MQNALHLSAKYWRTTMDAVRSKITRDKSSFTVVSVVHISCNVVFCKDTIQDNMKYVTCARASNVNPFASVTNTTFLSSCSKFKLFFLRYNRSVCLSISPLSSAYGSRNLHRWISFFFCYYGSHVNAVEGLSEYLMILLTAISKQ